MLNDFIGWRFDRTVIPPKTLQSLLVNLFTLFPFIAPGVFMLYSTGRGIRRILFNSSDNLNVVLPFCGLSNVLAIDFDINSNLVFWIDGAHKTIRCAFQNGTNAKTIKLDPAASPYDLAIDPYGQQMFWTDAASDSIQVYSLRSNTNLGVVFQKENVSPRSIVLYPEKG